MTSLVIAGARVWTDGDAGSVRFEPRTVWIRGGRVVDVAQASAAPRPGARSDVHVAIRSGKGRWPQLHVEKLFDEYLVPLCTPQLLARHGPLAGPGPVGDYPLLHSSSEPWEMWTQGERYAERWPERAAKRAASAPPTIWPTSAGGVEHVRAISASSHARTRSPSSSPSPPDAP